MKQTLEIVVIVAAVLLAAVLFRELRARSAAQSGAVGVGLTSDAPVPGTPPPTPAVQSLPPIKTRAQPRVLRTAAPPPPSAATAN